MYITEREQHLLFDEYNTPIHVQRHCNEVARVAGILAEALDRHGYHIDVKLVYGAALVHDVFALGINMPLRAGRFWQESGSRRKRNWCAGT